LNKKFTFHIFILTSKRNFSKKAVSPQQDFIKVILTEIQMMDIRKIPNLKMTNDKAQMSNQAQNLNVNSEGVRSE